jgi:hypothetical protein
MERSMTEKSRSEYMRELEHRRFGRLLWQTIPDGRRMIVECFDYPKARTVAIVTKYYESRIPRSGSAKPWPVLESAEIFIPAESQKNTWASLDEALDKYEASRARIIPAQFRIEGKPAWGIGRSDKPEDYRCGYYTEGDGVFYAYANRKGDLQYLDKFPTTDAAIAAIRAADAA